MCAPSGEERPPRLHMSGDRAPTPIPHSLHRLCSLALSVFLTHHGRPTRSAISPRRERRRPRATVVQRRWPIPFGLRDPARPLLPVRVPSAHLDPDDEPDPAHALLRCHVRAGTSDRSAVPAQRQPDALFHTPPDLGPAFVHLHVAVRHVCRRWPPWEPRRARPRPLALALVLAFITYPLPLELAFALVLTWHPALALARVRADAGNEPFVRRATVVISAGALGDVQHGDRAVRFPGRIRATGERVAIPRVATASVRVRHVRAVLQPPARPEETPRHAHGREAVLLQRRVREDLHPEGCVEEASGTYTCRRPCIFVGSRLMALFPRSSSNGAASTRALHERSWVVDTLYVAPPRPSVPRH